MFGRSPPAWCPVVLNVDYFCSARAATKLILILWLCRNFGRVRASKICPAIGKFHSIIHDAEKDRKARTGRPWQKLKRGRSELKARGQVPLYTRWACSYTKTATRHQRSRQAIGWPVMVWHGSATACKTDSSVRHKDGRPGLRSSSQKSGNISVRREVTLFLINTLGEWVNSSCR